MRGRSTRHGKHRARLAAIRVQGPQRPRILAAILRFPSARINPAGRVMHPKTHRDLTLLRAKQGRDQDRALPVCDVKLPDGAEWLPAWLHRCRISAWWLPWPAGTTGLTAYAACRIPVP